MAEKETKLTNIRRIQMVNEMVVNGGNMAKAMKKVGYKPNYAKNPQKLRKTNAYKEVVSSVIERIEAEREAIINRLPKVRAKAKYRDLMDGLDKTTKTIQLLSGKPTDIAKVIDEETRAKSKEIVRKFLGFGRDA